MLPTLIHNIYTKRSYFFALVAIDFVVVVVFAFFYANLLPWIEGKAALRYNVVREGSILESPVTDPFNCLYFSITTQMTVGFGDIIPSTHLAKAVVSVQAIFGYFYVAILISILVGRIFWKQRTSSPAKTLFNN